MGHVVAELRVREAGLHKLGKVEWTFVGDAAFKMIYELDQDTSLQVENGTLCKFQPLT